MKIYSHGRRKIVRKTPSTQTTDLWSLSGMAIPNVGLNSDNVFDCDSCMRKTQVVTILGNFVMPIESTNPYPGFYVIRYKNIMFSHKCLQAFCFDRDI